MKTVSNFTEGPILGPLLRFAFPILFIVAYNLLGAVFRGLGNRFALYILKFL